LAQVHLANLVAVESGTSAFRQYFNPIAMKCVDFVVVQRDTMTSLLVIELDDRSHERIERRERDRPVDDVLSSAAIPILHWPVMAYYNREKLVQTIAAKLR